MIAKQSIGKSFAGALNYNLKKLNHSDPKQRAEVLSTNFNSLHQTSIRKELAIMKAMNPRLKRNTYHTSLNFAVGEKINNQKMQNIAEEYLKRMGFDNNLHIIFRHHDSSHPHCHILALRNRFDGTVVSDSNNFKRSEEIIRELEIKYNLEQVKSSKHSKFKAPDKDELEMIQRTGRPSQKLILQEKVKDALKYSSTMQDFIHNLDAQYINVLFNQASTGRVSGITYQIPGFKIRGQALGNQFKFGSITKQINYEQSRDNQAIHQANNRTRARFGKTEKKGYTGDVGWHQGFDGFESKYDSKSKQYSQLSAKTSSRYYSGKETDQRDGKETDIQSVDFKDNIRGNTLAPSSARHILENLFPYIPVEPEAKKKRNEEERKNRGLRR
jgi:hypothetical protein